MKLSGFLSLCAIVPTSVAFTSPQKKAARISDTALGDVSFSRWDDFIGKAGGTSFGNDANAGTSGSVPPTDFELFPEGTFKQWETVQGGGTVRTYSIPPWAERVQYTLKSNGRPLKATVNLWIGPIRQVHNLEIDSMDGLETPYSGILKFKKLAPYLKISTSDDLQLPIQCSVSIPSMEFSDALADNYDTVWGMATSEQKLTVQGGNTDGSGGGAVRTWIIPDDVQQVQLLGWSKDVGKKSFRAKIEVLRGPNNPRQTFKLQCGGSTQPYHGVFQTPGSGWQVRITNQKFLEDGKIEYALLPYEGNCPGHDVTQAVGSGAWYE